MLLIRHPFFLPSSLLLVSALLGTGCVSRTVESDTSSQSSPQRETSLSIPTPVTIFFSADFANGSLDGTNEDFDLYSAQVDLTTGDVNSVVRLTDTEASELNATTPADGSFVVFQQTDGRRADSLASYQVQGGTVSTLVNGKAPDVSADGTRLLYADGQKIYETELFSDGTSFGEKTPVTDFDDGRYTEPSFSADETMALVYQFNEERVNAAVITLSTGDIRAISPEDGTGHCDFSPTTTLALCDNKSKGGILGSYVTATNATPMDIILPNSLNEQALALDSDFAPCVGMSLNFPEFCGDGDHVLVSASCKMSRQDDDPAFSKLFLYTLSTQQLFPVGKNLAESFGGTGFSSKTGACTRR